MEVIARIVRGKKFRRSRRVVRRDVLIDHTIAAAAGAANEAIDLRATRFALAGPVAGDMVRRQSRAQEPAARLVRAIDELSQPADELSTARRRAGRTEIVDGIVGKYQPPDARLREHVAIEAIERAFSGAVDQEPV